MAGFYKEGWRDRFSSPENGQGARRNNVISSLLCPGLYSWIPHRMCGESERMTISYRNQLRPWYTKLYYETLSENLHTGLGSRRARDLFRQWNQRRVAHPAGGDHEQFLQQFLRKVSARGFGARSIQQEPDYYVWEDSDWW
uniref:Histone H2b.1 n=1 Tax=Camellia sinensis TaxID=4442 RepID=F4YFD3_CAMSI|nr:histone H2b.1 [Camellia sinensis]